MQAGHGSLPPKAKVRIIRISKAAKRPTHSKRKGTLSALGYIVRMHCKAGGYVGNCLALLLYVETSFIVEIAGVRSAYEAFTSRNILRQCCAVELAKDLDGQCLPSSSRLKVHPNVQLS